MTSALLLLAATLAPKWVPTFTQNFDGPKGQAPDPAIWGRDLGGGGFGNNELESYTDGNANAFLDGDGHLVIEARKEPTKGKDGIARDYSSARLKTKGKFEQRYGKIEARMKLPKGQGIWPAFWMLGSDIDRAGWPKCGEIDILEFIGREPKTVFGTLHGPGYSGSNGIQGKTTSPDLSDAFHTYGIEWAPGKIVWTFDGKPFHTVEAKDVGAKGWPFEQPFFVILNLAVGGGWPGYPDATTTFPQRLVVDWVRAYKDENLKVDDAEITRRNEERVKSASSYKDPGPQKVPGTVRFADYLPGEGVGFHDTDGENEGGVYRTDGVDVGNSGLADVPYSLGWTRAGEWLTYDLDVSEPGNYAAEIAVACEGAGGTIELSLDGGQPFATVAVPNTGGWTTWKTIPAGVAPMLAGRHKLRLTMKSNGVSGSVGNLAYLKLMR